MPNCTGYAFTCLFKYVYYITQNVKAGFEYKYMKFEKYYYNTKVKRQKCPPEKTELLTI